MMKEIDIAFSKQMVVLWLLAAIVLIWFCVSFEAPSVSAPNVQQWTQDTTWSESWFLPKL